MLISFSNFMTDFEPLNVTESVNKVTIWPALKLSLV